MKLIVSLALYTGIALGGGICIPEPIKSSLAEGTVYFGSEQYPLPDVRVEIAGYDYGAPIVASTTSGKDGHFSVAGIKPGRYWIKARHPTLGYLAVEFRMLSFSHQKRRLLIVIGDDPSKGACWGGYAKVVQLVGPKGAAH